jgi:hypothetical protein
MAKMPKLPKMPRMRREPGFEIASEDLGNSGNADNLGNF